MADSKRKNKGNFTCQAEIKNSMSLKGKSTATDFPSRGLGVPIGSGCRYYSPVLSEVSGCQAQKLSLGFRVPTTAGPFSASKSAGSVVAVGVLSRAGLEIPESQVSGGWGRNEPLCLQQLQLGALTGGRTLPGQKRQTRANWGDHLTWTPYLHPRGVVWLSLSSTNCFRLWDSRSAVKSFYHEGVLWRELGNFEVFLHLPSPKILPAPITVAVFAGSCLLPLPLVALISSTLGGKLHNEGPFYFHQVRDSVSCPHHTGILDTVLKVEVRRSSPSRSRCLI